MTELARPDRLYAGYIFATRAFALADWARQHLALGVAGLIAWGIVNGLLVFNGLADLPLVGLALGTAGALAVIVTSALLTQAGIAAPLAHCGRQSIVNEPALRAISWSPPGARTV